MSHRVEASATVRRASLIAAIVLAVLEIGVFASAWRLGVLLDPGDDRRAAPGLVMRGTALTVQAMAVGGVAWTLMAWSRSTLTIDDDELVLEHPWREWRGGWHEVRHAWMARRWLCEGLARQWRRGDARAR